MTPQLPDARRRTPGAGGELGSGRVGAAMGRARSDDWRYPRPEPDPVVIRGLAFRWRTL